MRIAVIGAAGQLGADLVPQLGPSAMPVTHADCDITQAESIRRWLDSTHPDRVINLAAYNLVDKAEEEPEAAFAVNAFGVRNLAKACGERGIPLLHVSTDYVFGGNRASEPLSEAALPGPVSVYGASKLMGECFVQAECPQHFVVRTCGLYGQRATRGKGNFVETMLKLAATRPELRVIDDQHCTPTSTANLAVAIADLIQTDAFGLYHATNSGAATWYQFACEIFRLAGKSVKVTPIASSDFNAKARRPAYSVLNCDKLAKLRSVPLPSWQDGLSRYLKQREIATGEAS